MARKISVRLGNTVYEPFAVPNGVPQGPVISPILFILMINNLLNEVPEEVHCSLYVDDCVLWVRGLTVKECSNKMQAALETVARCSLAWGLQMSTSKTKAMLFTHKRKIQYTLLLLYDVPIEYVKSLKFLGLTFDSKLSWRNPIYEIRDRCQKNLRLLSVVAGKEWGADFFTLRKLYIGVIQSKIDYESFIYGTAAPLYLEILNRI